MDQFAAQERLLELMDEPSAETRYGAFYALRCATRRTRWYVARSWGRNLRLHQVATRGEPMIHFARARRPEIVIFGHGLTMKPPGFLFAGEQILIKAVDDRQVKVSRFRPGKETEHLVCSNQVAEIVRTIVQLGGGYPDAIMALQAARQKEYLACRIELEALPGEDAGRERARALVVRRPVGRRPSRPRESDSRLVPR